MRNSRKESLKMNIAICDDCIEDIIALRDLLMKFTDENLKSWIINIYSCAEEFIECANENDLVLLDIEMPGVNGIEAGLQAKKRNPELKIIMFTGAEGYGEEIFDIGAVDYIKKPFKSERVINAITKIESAIVGDDFIAANMDWMPYELKQKQVQYIRAYNGYILLYCNNKEYRIDKSLKEIEKVLDSRIFLRIDKSIIVNLLYVKMLTENGFAIGADILKISRRRYSEVKKAWIEFDLKFNAGGCKLR